MFCPSPVDSYFPLVDDPSPFPFTGFSPDPSAVEKRIRKSGQNPASESGASLLESLIGLLTLVIAGFAVFEIAQWHLTRQLAWLAIHEAGRRGAVMGADPRAIRSAVQEALAPRAGSVGRAGNAHIRQRQLAHTHADHQSLPAWHIEVLTPSAPMFVDFSDGALSRGQRLPTISNDYLAEQHAAHLMRGWQDGRGPISGKTIFEANTLGLRLTVLHAPLSPGAATLLRLLPDTGNALTDAARRRGLLAITIESATVMHSHPVQWTQGRDQQVRTDASENETGKHVNSRNGVVPSFRHDAARIHADKDPGPDPAPGSRDAFDPGMTQRTARMQDAASDAHRSDGAKNIDGTKDHDALCGTLLCCRAEE